jgi:hypothetical protein
MGVPTSEVGYTSAITAREDHEVHRGYLVALAQKKNILAIFRNFLTSFQTINNYNYINKFYDHKMQS